MMQVQSRVWSCFSIFCVSIYREIQSLNGIEPLINCLVDSREEAVANAACVLTNLAQIEALRVDAQNKGVVRALIEPLNSK